MSSIKFQLLFLLATVALVCPKPSSGLSQPDGHEFLETLIQGDRGNCKHCIEAVNKIMKNAFDSLSILGDLARNFCNHTGPFVNLCKTYVVSPFDMAANALQAASPGQVCQSLYQC